MTKRKPKILGMHRDAASGELRRKAAIRADSVAKGERLRRLSEEAAVRALDRFFAGYRASIPRDR